MRPGPSNTLVDVSGLRVGHCTRDEPGWLTGTTVVVAPPGGMVAGVDVRGGGPGTRETDLLDPRNLVDRVQAILIGGGSAPGLAAADGVVQGLFDDGVGWEMDTPEHLVPIVPGAILFDLGRAGTWRNHPGATDGRAAYDAATDAPVALGNVGAGTGARAGGFKGGLGSASVVLESGVTVAALVAVNAVGWPVDLGTGELYAARFGLGDEFGGVGRPSPEDVAAARECYASRPDAIPGLPGMATTIGIVATDVSLGKAQCQKLAGIAHDGFARALRPVHTLFDGDTIFGVSTAQREPLEPEGLAFLMEAGADCMARAIGHAVLAAESVDRTGDGGIAMRSWRAAFPSALTRSTVQQS
ncbi:P1 family peptidase [Intrasporangium sp.]|uniref:P1 family peptidase n=1 Tax=Intrasporangium sp. TaxID=1925024 RepID=UPI0032221969